LLAGVVPAACCLLQVLAESSTEVRELDVYCIDSMTPDRALIDFHMRTAVFVGPPAQ